MSSCCFVSAAVICSSSARMLFLQPLWYFIRFFKTPVSFFSFFFSALCRYLLPRLRVVSPVQQLSVPLQHVCCSSCSLSDLLASHYSEHLSAFFLSLKLLFFLFFWSGLFCCVLVYTRYASISLALPWLIAVVLVLLCPSLWPQNLYLSRMKNQHGHWVYCWCRWVERTV